MVKKRKQQQIKDKNQITVIFTTSDGKKPLTIIPKLMSQNRLRILLENCILPFPFAYTHEDWIRFWDLNPDTRDELVGTNPRTWSQKKIDQAYERAEIQTTIYNHFASLSKKDFDRQLEVAIEEGWSEKLGNKKGSLQIAVRGDLNLDERVIPLSLIPPKGTNRKSKI